MILKRNSLGIWSSGGQSNRSRSNRIIHVIFVKEYITCCILDILSKMEDYCMVRYIPENKDILICADRCSTNQ